MSLLFHLKAFLKLLKTAEFGKGISFAVAAILPLLISGYFDELQVGISMAIGVLLCSPSDVPGSLRRRVVGVAFSITIAVFATLVSGYASGNDLVFVPILILLMFGFSMISVYGFRASLISFSGLFAVVLSMAKVASEGGVLTHALLLGCGGIWYLCFTLVLHFINERKEAEILLAEAFDLTADYLKIRAKLLDLDPDEREQYQKELFELQTSINEKHEIIREMLISRRRNFGRSGMVRKKLLVFMEVVDVLELSMANPVNYSRMTNLFAERSHEINLMKEWSLSLAKEIKAVGEAIRTNKKYSSSIELKAWKVKVTKAYNNLQNSASTPLEREAVLVYRNLYDFKEKQNQKLLSLERLLTKWDGKIDLNLKQKELAKFLTTQDYDLKTLQDNLDLKSAIFRHSLRLTVTLVAGYFVGRIFEFQNPYWILLTTLVIMRPGYALTRDRFKQRLYGTLIGGAIAVGIVLLFQNKILFGILAVISLILAFSMIQRNYKTAAAFITLNVVFVYSLLRPDALMVIEYRVLDTIIGAGLAYLANKFLWPTWEYSTIDVFIEKSLAANAVFIKEIEDFYTRKKELPAKYRLARKEAFLAIGNLNAAFQRMAQEPKSEKDQLEEVFSLVSLNQEFLASAASLGTFIRSHTTTEASKHFKTYIRAIRKNIENVHHRENIEPESNTSEIVTAEAFFEGVYSDALKNQRVDMTNELSFEEEDISKLQEIQMLREQLKWLYDISGNIKALMQKRRKV